MPPVSVLPSSQSRAAGLLLALESFADELCGTLARLVAYVGMLALLGILSLALWQQIGGPASLEPTESSGWAIADDAVPAFALRLGDQPDKSATYTVLRHGEGGRKDVIRWGEPAEQRPLAELEIYRPGGERDAKADSAAELARRMDARGSAAFEAAGVIDSKFGTVALLRRTGTTDGPGGCLGFLKSVGNPDLRLSGWSCQGVSGPVRRAAIGCMLNRLTLLSADHEPDLATLFSRTEGTRSACSPGMPAGTSADWVTSAEDPRLRGAL